MIKKAVTIPKIVTPTSSPGIQKKESYQGLIIKTYIFLLYRRHVRATITLYPIGRPVRVTITLSPIGRPVRVTITLYPIGRPVRATITLYPMRETC